ncbi:MAG TPA: DUF4331 family protein [Methylomirabilota bacterium]|nr:DUF4331 family protein [Methylomirabilota bacterium]
MLGLFVALLAVFLAVPVGILQGADHRDAPSADEDPVADIADVYTFINPLDTSKLVIAMTVNGFAVPAVRATYSLGPDVLYQFKIDNTGDANEDLVIQVTADGFEASGLRDPRCTSAAGGQFIEVVGPAKPKKVGNVNELVSEKHNPTVSGCTNTVLSANGIRAWAGLAADPFVVDISQFNRITARQQAAFRNVPASPLGPLPGRPIRADGTSGVDSFGGFNVSAIVVEVPISLVIGNKNRTSTYLHNNSTIAVWGTTSRPRNRHLSEHREARETGNYVQIQRMGQQVFKTVFIFTDNALKEVFNRSIPAQDGSLRGLLPDALTTTDTDGTGNTTAGRAAVLTALGVTAPPGGAPLLLGPAFPNTDKDLIRNVLLPDVLRIDLSLLPPGDFAVANNGYQNGRRFNDDVIDILLQLARQLADVKFPDGALGGIPGSGPLGSRKALDCSNLATCDQRVFAVLQGTDWIKKDTELLDLNTNGDDSPLRNDFPFIGVAHPLPGNPVTVGFPPQQ